MIGKIWNFYVKKMQKFVIVLVGVLLPLICLSGCTKKEEESFLLLELEETNSVEEQPDCVEQESLEVPAEGENSEAVLQKEAEPFVIYVHVCGAVVKPGVYEFEYGSRVYEAVEAAGGFIDEADTGYVNQAQLLEDGAKLVIPTLQQTKTLYAKELKDEDFGVLSKSGESVVKESAQQKAGLVNINTAGREELMSLPGIGETRADAILQYRMGIGAFVSKEQIMEIDGIKSGLYSKLQDKICVE